MQILQLFRIAAFGLFVTLTIGTAYAQTTNMAKPAASGAKPSPAATATGKIGASDVTVNMMRQCATLRTSVDRSMRWIAVNLRCTSAFVSSRPNQPVYAQNPAGHGLHSG